MPRVGLLSFNSRTLRVHSYNPHLHTPQGKDLATAGLAHLGIAGSAPLGIAALAGSAYLAVAGSAYASVATIAGSVYLTLAGLASLLSNSWSGIPGIGAIACSAHPGTAAMAGFVRQVWLTQA